VFAIIDIETCGGTFQYKKGRITEICILVHDGLSVVEKFSTLVNPECTISSRFIDITGITNEMVKDAPKFHEIARDIIRLTEGHIFVAHNVNFDYGFIKEEFASLGYKYRRDTLCTVRLSRKLIPGKVSYSLGNLCESLGIYNQARHRAEGDALATAELFDRLIQIKTVHPQYKRMGVEEIMTRRIDNIKKYILNKLPETCGVYYFLDKEQNIIYIGKSTNMYSRAQSHFNNDEKKARNMLNDMYNVDFVETGSELVALLLEAEEIKKHKPQYNRAKKADQFQHSIDYFIDENGIINFKLAAGEEIAQPLLSFNKYGSARERLDTWIDEFELCLRYCGLTGTDAQCFNHQIKKCKGICCNAESVVEYNKRAAQILDKYSFQKKSFVLIDKGGNQDEKTVMYIENGHYWGYGHIDSEMQVNNAEDFKTILHKANYYPDADDLLRSMMRRNKYKVVNL
jgi:DNA polymerase-3 subunit epsilon